MQVGQVILTEPYQVSAKIYAKPMAVLNHINPQCACIRQASHARLTSLACPISYHTHPFYEGLQAILGICTASAQAVMMQVKKVACLQARSSTLKGLRCTVCQDGCHCSYLLVRGRQHPELLHHVAACHFVLASQNADGKYLLALICQLPFCHGMTCLWTLIIMRSPPICIMQALQSPIMQKFAEECAMCLAYQLLCGTALAIACRCLTYLYEVEDTMHFMGPLMTLHCLNVATDQRGHLVHHCRRAWLFEA